MIGPEPFAPFSSSHVLNSTSFRLRAEHLARLLASLSPDNLHLLSGCSYLKAFQLKIGNVTDNICDKCETEEETLQHYLLRCPAFALQLWRTFGNFIIRQPRIAIVGNITNLLNFAASTRYLSFYDPAVT